MTKSFSDPSTMNTNKQMPQQCVPDDNEDLMILAECAIHSVTQTPASFMAVPSSPSHPSSPAPYPPSSPNAFAPPASPDYLYDSPQVEFTKDFIVTLQQWIERCLQEQLTLEESCTAIYYQFGIDPRVTEIVWRKLEEENPLYFKEYSNRLQQRMDVHMGQIHPTSIF